MFPLNFPVDFRSRRSLSGMEARAEERLKLDRENIAFQQQQMQANQELNSRLSNIEKLLKEVD